MSHFKKFNADKVNLADERSTDSEDEDYRSIRGNNNSKEKEQVQENEAQQERPKKTTTSTSKVWLSHSFTAGKMNINKRF